MKLDLSLLDKAPLSFEERLSLPSDRLDQNQVAGEVVVRLVGTARAASGGYVIEGTIEASGQLVCARCLEPVPWQLKDGFSVEYRTTEHDPGEGEFPIDRDDLNVAFVDGTELELEDLAAEQVILALPMRILCDEACAGLCPRCGANRNREGACRCKPEPDPRWQALGELSGRRSTN